MLNTIPEQVRLMARNVVINHPNAWNCQIFRKTVERQAPTESGGLPTLGGLGVVSAEDEEAISWEFLGDGFAISADPFQSAPMMDRQDANNGAIDEFRMLIEPEAPGAFTLKKQDVVYLLLDDIVKLAFEIVDIEATINIPPYAIRYVLNRRDDLHL